MAGPTATTSDILFGLYDAYFLRAPDLKGYTFWQQGIADGTATVSQMSQSFYMQQYAQNSPPNGLGYAAMSDDAFVKAIYANVLSGSGSDAPAQAEVNYWVNFLKTNTRGDFVSTFITAGLTYDTATITDPAAQLAAQHRQDALWNKIEVGKDWLTTLGASTNVSAAAEADQSLLPFDPAFQAGQKIYSGVTYNDSTMSSAENFIASIKTNPDPMGAVNSATDEQIFGGGTSTTYHLTTANDTATANIFEGTVVVSAGNPNTPTFNPGDVLTGTGDNPTLNADLVSQIGLNNALAGIKTVNFNVLTASVFDASKAMSITTLSDQAAQPGGNSDLTVRNLQQNVAFTYQNAQAGGGADADIRFATSVVSGTADTATVTLSNNGTTLATGAAGVVNLRSETTGGFETMGVTSQGVNHILDIGSDSTVGLGAAITTNNSLRTLNVGGTGLLWVDNVLQQVTKVDASANSGGVRIRLDPLVNANVMGSTGNDVLTFGAGLDNNDTVNGNGGLDRIDVSNAAGLGVGNKVTDIDILNITGITANFIFNNDNVTSINEVWVNNQNVAAPDVTLQNLGKVGASTNGVKIQTDSTGAANYGTVTISEKGAADAGSINDVLKLELGKLTAHLTGTQDNSFSITSLVVNDIETINLNVVDGSQSIGGFTNNALTTLNITGGVAGTNLNFGALVATGTALTVTNPTVAINNASVINGETYLGNLGILGSDSTTLNQVIKGGSGNDVIWAGGVSTAATAAAVGPGGGKDVLAGGLGNDNFVFRVDAGTTDDMYRAYTGSVVTRFTNAGPGAFADDTALLSTIDQIADLNLGTATTSVDVVNIKAGAAGTASILNGGTATAITGLTMGAALNTYFGTANSLGGVAVAGDTVGLITYGAHTFLVGTTAGNATAGYQQADGDFIIEVTGVVGTLNATDVHFIA